MKKRERLPTQRHSVKKKHSFRNPFVRKGSALSMRQLRGFQVEKIIGRGAYGKVYKASKAHSSSSSFAIKIVDSSTLNPCQFQMECWITEWLSLDAGIGPTFHGSWTVRADGKRLGMLATELWDMTLEEFMKTRKRKTVPKVVLEKIWQQLKQMHSHFRLIHMDVHSGNILLKLSPSKVKVIDATLADFGNATNLDAPDMDLMSATIDMYDLPHQKHLDDPKKIDHSLFTRMKNAWKLES